MIQLNKTWGFALALALFAAPMEAQTGMPVPGEEAGLVDRVVAVVGDSVIFLTQLQEEMLLLQAQNPIPEEPNARRQAMRDLLDQLVNLQLVLQEASKDSTLLPTDDEIDARVQETVDQVQTQFGSAAALQQALAADGLTTATYRETLRKRIREQQIQQLFLERRLADASTVAVTEAEMREMFNAQADQLAQQQRPEVLDLQQVIIRATASDEAWDEKKAIADSLVTELRNGADFAELALIFSNDPGTNARGGELDWFRRGVMLREFEDAAFSLPDGVISNPVRTDIGWHIIRIDRRRPGELKGRHILLIPEGSDTDMARSIERAQTFADRARAGEDMGLLQDESGDLQSIDYTVTREQIDGELPPGYSQALVGVQTGDVVGPFQTQLGPATVNIVLKVAERRDAGAYVFEDFEEQIRGRLQQQKQLERLWESLRASTYIDIRF